MRVGCRPRTRQLAESAASKHFLYPIGHTIIKPRAPRAAVTGRGEPWRGSSQRRQVIDLASGQRPSPVFIELMLSSKSDAIAKSLHEPDLAQPRRDESCRRPAGRTMLETRMLRARVAFERRLQLLVRRCGVAARCILFCDLTNTSRQR